MVSKFMTILLHSISFIVSHVKGTYIIDNGIDVRLISDANAFCEIGRVEFYDGLNWGSSHRLY